MTLTLNTFSIVARSADAKSYGVAVATARPAVGTLVPFVNKHGAIATQARVNTDYGKHGLNLLNANIPINQALELLVASDDARSLRQVHGVDASTQYAFTGEDCVPFAGHKQSSGVSVAGNMLTGEHVLSSMLNAFKEHEELELSERLLLALEAGQAAGGDKRGKQSAALLVFSDAPRLYHNIRVDDHGTPVVELRRIYGVLQAQARDIFEQYGEEGLRLFSRIKV